MFLLHFLLLSILTVQDMCKMYNRSSFRLLYLHDEDPRQAKLSHFMHIKQILCA